MWGRKKVFESDVRLDGKTVVLTGGNNGIGRVAAKDLYQRGAKVVIASRNEEKSKSVIEEIKKEVNRTNQTQDIRSKYLDLSDLSSVRRCAQELLEEESQINLLINNAGVMGNATKISKDGFEFHFAANYLGHFLLTLLLLPKIIESGPARIINVSSCGHKFIYFTRNLDLKSVRNVRRWLFQLVAYCQSKLAQVLFTKELARRLKAAGVDNVTTYSLHPGIVATNLFESWDIFCCGLAWLWGRFLCALLFLTPEQGAQTTLYCALDEDIAKESGCYYSHCHRYPSNSLVDDENVCKKLWDKSIEFTNLGDYDPFKKPMCFVDGNEQKMQ